MAIILLLASSIVLSILKQKPTISKTTFILNDTSKASTMQNKLDDDNPYGFHPFYQAHKRIQFQNPPTYNPCRNIDPSRTLLLAILSRASNVHIREAIRQTWGAMKVYNNIEIRVSFIVGVDDGMLKQIAMEQSIYHDVIQVNLPENYPIVSYKELAALCWSRYFCSNIQYIFKADEDIHLNIPLLTSLVSNYMKNETIADTPLIFGWFRHKSRVDRSGRYIVTQEEYPGFYYPPYTFGIGYLLTKSGRDNLCVSAQRPHPVTRVGDAYITGILRDHAEVNYARFGDVHYIYSYTLNGARCQEYFTYDPKLLICMSSVHSGSSDVADEYVHVWNIIFKDDNNALDDQE
ncbi:unnamed protein product [Adineta ricciae]|uniref:Hexosyltransferase n=1 Tax=Adineta ricciae TaxID=249248 RepID=A0A814WRN2_ADIRI|nr:unnamed protein product [Adineta ricciae]CAF1204660.1 unnamed protein product [Adineta ricciae]